MQNQSSLLFILPLQTNNDVLSVGVSSRLVYEGSPCDAFPCWNGGTCVELRKRKGQAVDNASKAYTCKCRPLFTGSHCEQRIPSCQEKCPEGTPCPPHECIPADASVEEGDERKHGNKECPLNCQNGGICLRLGTAPGHLECLCPANFGGPLCQFESTLAAPLLPGLLLLSLLLFVLALLLLLCHGPATAGFFLQMIGNKRARKDSRKRPLLEWEREDDEEMAEGIGDSFLEMRECRRPTSGSSSSSLFSLKNNVQLPTGTNAAFSAEIGADPSKAVHI